MEQKQLSHGGSREGPVAVAHDHGARHGRGVSDAAEAQHRSCATGAHLPWPDLRSGACPMLDALLWGVVGDTRVTQETPRDVPGNNGKQRQHYQGGRREGNNASFVVVVLEG